MSTRFVSEEPHRVAPEHVGAELASPLRRGAALAIDLLLLFVPSLLVAIGVVAVVLSIRHPGALGALGTIVADREGSSPAAWNAAMKTWLPILVEAKMPGLSAEVRRASEEGRPDEAAEALGRQEFLVVLNLDSHAEEHGDAGAEATGKAPTVRVELQRLLPRALRVVTAYGLAALYFAFLHAGRKGATLGKRLLGLRVVRLDGHRLTLPESFERFVGYLHIPGSLGFNLVDLWHDRNRRLPHDRVAHTAVLRLRAPAKKSGRAGA
jgi:uncharacterized RDD family membrane protein YckC